MRAYEQAHGTRILDYFDMHFYPQGSGVAFGNGNDPATNALRLRSTRALWDPTYVDESWINTPVALIPRMQDAGRGQLPGHEDRHHRVQLGRARTTSTARWRRPTCWASSAASGWTWPRCGPPPSADQPGAYAFRMYRNYDGAGGRFGDVGVRATSADQDQLAVYAAERSADGALTIMVVNKTGDDLTTTMSVSTGTGALASTAQVWRYSAANLAAVVREDDLPILVPPPTFPPGPHGIPATYPANSITLLVLPGRVPDTEPPSPPGTPVASDITSTGFTVTWPPATDNVGVTGYTVVASPGGDVVSTGNTSATTFTFTDLSPGREYRVGVHARDAAGNLSDVSPQITVRTLPPEGTGCVATYQIVNSWPGGFLAEVTVRNPGASPLNGWTVRWTYPPGESVSHLWNGTLLTNAPDVSVRNAAWNGTIEPNRSVTFGFLGASSSPATPALACAAPS